MLQGTYKGEKTKKNEISMLMISFSNQECIELPIIQEVPVILREWVSIAKQLYIVSVLES